MIVKNLFYSFIADDKKAASSSWAFSMRETVLAPVLSLITQIGGSARSPGPRTPFLRQKKIDKEKLIREHSLLETEVVPVLKTKKREHLPALLGQIHADEIILNTSLEKLPSTTAIDTFDDYLKNLDGIWGEKAPEGLKQLKQNLSQMHKVAEEFATLPDKMRDEKAEIEHEKSAKQEEIAALKEQIKPLEKEKATLRSSLDAATWNLSVREQDVIASSAYFYREENRKNMANLKEQIAALEKKVYAKAIAIKPLAIQLEKLKEELQTLQERDERVNPIYRMGRALMQQVYALDIGSTFIIPGGYTKDGIDYPIVYEFVKGSEGKYDLLVYLVGRDQGQYRTLLYKDGKEWIRPVIHYKNIPEGDLFFNDVTQTIQPDFFQAIVEIKILPGSDATIAFANFHLLGHLQQYRLPANQETIGFISASNSDSDAWRSSKVIAFNYLEKEEYKTLIAEIKLNSLIEGYQLTEGNLLEKDTQKGASLRESLKAGALGILRYLLRQEERGSPTGGSPLGGSPPSERSLAAEATAYDLLQRIEIIERGIEKTRKEKSAPLLLDTCMQGGKIDRAGLLEDAKDLIVHPKATPAILNPTLPRLEKLPEDPSLFNEYLLERLHYYNANKIDPKVQKAEIETLAELLPIPSSNGESRYLSGVHVEDLPSTIDALEKLLRVYDNATRELNSVTTPYETNSVYTFFAVIHFFALCYDKTVNDRGDRHPSSLAFYPIYFPGIVGEADQYLNTTSPNSFERRNQIFAYFKGTFLNNPNLGYEYKPDSFGWAFEWQKKGRVPYPLFNFGKHPLLYDGNAESKNFAFFLEFMKAHPSLEIRDTHRKSSFSAETLQVATFLISLTSPESTNPFKKAGLAHIPALAYAAFLAHQFSGDPLFRTKDKKTTSPFSITARISSLTDDTPCFSLKYQAHEKDLPKELTPNSSAMHPQMEAGYQKFLKLKWSSRIKEINEKPEEGEILAKKEIEKELPLKSSPKRLLLTTCEPQLQPRQLLYHYRNNMEILESQSEQVIFEIQFFKTLSIAESNRGGYIGDNKSQLFLDLWDQWFPYLRTPLFPLQEELAQREFIQECGNFIKMGIDSFFLLQPGGRPSVFPTLFFIRLSCRLSRFVDKENAHLLPDPIPLLEKILGEPHLKQEERSAASLHLILAYREKREELQDKELEKLFLGWVYYCNTPLPAAWKNPLLEKEIEDFLKTQMTFLKRLPEDFTRRVITLAVEQMGVDKLPTTCEITSSTPHIVTAQISAAAFWQLNIFTGEMTNESGILKRGATPTWVKRSNSSNTKNESLEFFTHLFGSTNYDFLQSGSTIYFKDELLGHFRVINGSLLKGLQRNIDGRWCQFITPEIFSKDQEIPEALLKSTTCWIPIADPLPSILFIHQTTGAKMAMVDSSGHLMPYDAELQAFDRTRELSHPKKSEEGELSFDDFELLEHILLNIHHGQLTSLTFTRYKSLTNEPLHFEVKEDKLIYASNKKYFLSPKQEEGWLGGIKGYRLLIHEKGSKLKLIVPLKPIAKYRRLSGLHRLDIEGKSPDQIMGDGSYYFLEFDIKGDSLLPLSKEGALFLAYISISQRKYLKAKELIKEVDYRDPLSNKSRDILHWIIDISNVGRDASHHAAACAMHALLLEAKTSAKGKIEGKQSSQVPPPKCERSKMCYKRYRNIIPSGLELSLEEEQFLKIAPQTQGTQTSYPKLQNYNSLHSRRIEAVSGYTTLPYEQAGLFDSFYKTHEVDINRQNVRYRTSFLPGSKEEAKKILSGYHNPHLLSLHPFGSESTTQAYFPGAFNASKSTSSAKKKQLAFRLTCMMGKNPNATPPP